MDFRFYRYIKSSFPKVDAAEILIEPAQAENDNNVIENNETGEPKKKKNKKQKIGFRDRKV